MVSILNMRKNWGTKLFRMFDDTVCAYHDNAIRKNDVSYPLPHIPGSKSTIVLSCN